MTSSDVEIFRSGLEDMKMYVDMKIQEVRTEIRTVNENVLVNSAKIDAYRDFMSIGFTIMTVIIGFFGFLVTLAPMLREMYQDRKRDKALTRSEVEEIVHSMLSRQNQ